MDKKNSSDKSKTVLSPREQGKLLASKSDKTLGYDQEIVDKIGIGPEGEFTGLQATYGQEDEHFFDPYENHVNRNTLRGGQFSVEELNKIRATNQSNWDQAGNAVARVAVNIVPQIVSGFSSMVDLPGYWDSEHAAQNSIVNWAQDLKKEVDEDWFPIYEESPKSMNISDPAWWMSRGSGLVESVGSFLAQGAGMGKLVSVGLKGAASLSKGKDLARMIMGAQKSKQLLQGSTGLANAVALNQSEAVISATQVFNDTYKDNLAKGYSLDKAKAMAAQAASTTMNLNRINILLNLSSASAFITPLKSTRQLLKQATKGTIATKLGIEGIQEGTEELINLVAEKAGTAKGKGKDYTFDNALEDMGTMEGFESAFLGAFGGIAQTAGTSALEYSKYGPGNTVDAAGNKISKATYEKEQYVKQQEIINDLKEKGVDATDILKNFKDNLVLQAKFTKASEEGNVAEVEKLKEQIFENQAIRSFESGTTETLEELYKAEAEKNPEEVGQEYVDNAKNAIVKLKELEAIYNNFEDYANVDEIFFNRSNKIRLEATAKNSENLKKQADFQLNKDLHTISAKYTYDREREILIKKDGEVTGTEKVVDKIPLSYSATDLENNQGHTAEEQAVYDKFLAEVKALPSFKAATNIEENLSKLDTEILNNSKEFEEITSKDYQKKAEQRKENAIRVKEAYTALPKINNISEILKLKESIDDEDFKKAADERIVSLKEDNNIAAKNKQTAVEIEKLNNKIKNATLETIEEISDEISKAELSQTHKTNLNNALNNKSRVLNGEPVEEEEEEEENPLANFSSKTPEELAAEVEADNATFATTIPKDFPNPNSEKETVENEVANAAQKLAGEDKTMIIGQDEQGNLIYDYVRSEEGHNRAAYLSREFNQNEVAGTVDREELGNSLDNIELLNPDFLTAGTALNMSVDTEYDGDKYDPNSDTRQKTPWILRKIELQKLADSKGIPLTELDEYIEEVPIKVTTAEGDTVFYVHDNSWYKEENLSASAEEIAEDREKNFKIRKAIVAKGIPVKTKVSYKSFGRLFKSFDGKAISVSEAMPDPNLIFAVGRNGTFELPGDASIVLKGGTILKSTAADGRVYAIVKVGPKEYLPIPLERQPISQEIINTVIFAIEAHLTGDSENAVVKAIAESSLGLDITNLKGLAKYLNQFIYLFPTDKAAGLESYLIQGGAGTVLKSNMPLISVTATGIEFGRPGVNMGSYVKNGVKVVKSSIVISQNFKSKGGQAANAVGLQKLKATLEKYTPLSNASRKDLSSNKDSVIILDNVGGTKTVKYSQVIKESHKTNILSVNVGTEENPVWAYTIQPTILFDTAFAKLGKGKQKRAARPKSKQIIPGKTEVTAVKEPASTVKKATIVRKYVTLETPITAFNTEEQALLNNPTPTIEEYEAVVQKLEKLVKIAKQPANKILFETALRDIKNSFEITEGTADIKADIERRREEEFNNITQEQVNDLLSYESGKGTILEQATRLINNYNRIYKTNAVITDFKNSRLFIKINGYETSIDSEAVKLGGNQFVYGIDKTGIEELINAKYDAELAALKETAQLTSNDKIIWAHPGLGKTTFRNANSENVLDFDTDFKPEVAKRLGLPEGQRDSVSLNAWRNKNKANEKKFETVMQKVWQEAIQESRKTGKMLLVSDMMFLRENANDFDKIITTDKETFTKRASERGDDVSKLESWKSSIDKTIVGIAQSKVVFTNKYFSELVETQKEKITPEEEVETLTGEALIDAYAKDIIASGTTLSDIQGIIENFDLGAIPLAEVLAMKFNSLEEAKSSFVRAEQIFIANSKKTETITLANGLVIKSNKNDVDTNPLEEDETDELVSEMTPEQLNAQREEIDEMIIRGLDTATQSSLISYLSSDIVNEGLNAKEIAGKKQVKVKPILDKHLESFKQLSKFYKEQGLPNKAARLDSVIAQFDKVRRLINQNMSKFSTGDVSEDVELDENEGVSGLVRTAYTDDWAFTVSAKSTSSADLKKFFSIVQAQDENGPMVNLLGLPEILSYDVVFNTLQELLTNIPADYSTMLDILELHQEKFPWIKSAIDQLEAAPEKIQNEFVSAMTKHHINMQFIMWSKDYKGNYSLQKWSSNSSSIEQRLKTIWNSNLKGVATQSNLITVNEDDEYVFNEAVAEGLKNQAAEWAKNPSEVTNDELAIWLGNFGIVLTDKTYEDLRKGKFNNKGRKTWNALFTNGAGLVKALSTALDKKVKGKVNFEDSELLNDSVVKALAKLDATNNLNTFSNSFQAGGKTIYSYGNNNFLINRMRDLTAYNSEDGTFVNPELIKSLQNISFTKNSAWLADLTNKESAGIAMRNTFKLNYLSLEALKKAFTKSQDNRKLNNLTTAEHEVAKIAFFQNVSGDNINGEDRRIVDFFYPTMSDKTTMLTISSLARELTLENGEISLKNLELLYDVLVTPEINRIRDKQSTDIKGYEPNYFYFLHSLNTLNIDSDAAGVNRSFLDIVKDEDDSVYSMEVKAAVLEEIKSVFNNLLADKLTDWDKLGIGKIITDDKGRVTDNYSFLDKEYMSSVAKGTGAAKTKFAAADYVFNYLIANAEAHKLFAGDPALYAKFNYRKSLTENLSETFTNIGKRLAGDIAPGMELANSVNNKYYQVFFEDEKMESNNVKDSAQKEFFSKIIKNFAKNYSEIEGSDAQEYTTWKEHLYVMKQLGRLTSVQYKNFYKKLEAQSKGDFRESNKLSYDEMGIIMQPMKPVYVGNTASVEDNADRRIYIKSSSFPLLPELTVGMQIDKIRKGLETFESEIGSKVTADGTPAFVRASFGTANKVGAFPESDARISPYNPNQKRSVKVFDDNGNVVDNLVITEENALLLSRQNFRIQQDVPYKREKDSVNIGTQERKLLFVNTLDLEIEPGVKGEDLMALYNKNYLELYEYAHEELSNKLGLVEEVSSKADITSLLTVPDSTIFDQNDGLLEKLKGASPLTKVQLQQDFAEEIGDNTLERVNFINKNFNSIIESLVNANMNVFFDENNEFKKCQ